MYEELKPCPFCDCDIAGPMGADDDEAAELWNRRAEVKDDE